MVKTVFKKYSLACNNHRIIVCVCPETLASATFVKECGINPFAGGKDGENWIAPFFFSPKGCVESCNEIIISICCAKILVLFIMKHYK